MAHKVLIRSSAVAALCMAVPAIVANAGTTVYNDQGTFDLAVGGQSMAWSEDFESYAPAYGYSMLPSPLSGLGDGSVSMSSSAGVFFAFAGNYYYPNMTSTTMGVLDLVTATMSFANGVDAVGMEMMGTSSFTAGFFDEIAYTVYDMSGGVLASGRVAGDGSGVAYLGLTSDTLIGSVDFWGTQFDGAIGAGIYADNVRGFAVPAPGSAAYLAIGGLAAIRRRR